MDNTPDTQPDAQPEQNVIKPEQQNYDPIIDEIGEACKKRGLNNAIFLALDPDANEAIIWYKGNKMTCARLTAYFTRITKMEVMKELET